MKNPEDQQQNKKKNKISDSHTGTLYYFYIISHYLINNKFVV